MISKEIVYLGGALAAAFAGIYVVWGPSLSGKQKRDKKDYCRGLENLGNTCFLNAVLQSWAACPCVFHWLKSILHRTSTNNRTCTFLAESLHKVMNVINDSRLDECNPYSPVNVIKALRQKRWVISPEEQDAHEFFQVLTQTLDEETSQYPGVVSLFDVHSVQDPNNVYQSKNYAATRSRGLLPVLPHRAMELPFRGLLASQLQCTECPYNFPVKYDLFNSLSLSIPTSFLGPLSLYMLLHHYICPEMVKNVHCPGCDKLKAIPDSLISPKSCFKKTLTLGKLPQCLCIHIQRTQWINNSVPVKRYDFISFPELLHMDSYIYRKGKRTAANKSGLLGGQDMLRFGNSKGRFVSHSAPLNLLRVLNYDSHASTSSLFVQTQGSQLPLNVQGDVNHNGPDIPKHTEFTYRLTSVLAHKGDESSGHFVTYRRTPGAETNDKWLYTSDATVERVAREQVLASEAYMLFYERLSH